MEGLLNLRFSDREVLEALDLGKELGKSAQTVTCMSLDLRPLGFYDWSTEGQS